MSVKKKATGRRSVKPEVEAPAGAQPAAERKSAEAELKTLIDEFAPEHRRLIAAMRKSLRERLPAAHEVVYEYRNQGAVVVSFSPNEHGYAGVLAIRGDAKGVKLYFNQGKDLPDPARLLQGSSQTRWINVESASALSRPEVARLIDEAFARNQVPFPSAGSGSVIVRSSTSKRRPRSRPA